MPQVANDIQAVANVTVAVMVVMVIAVFPWWVGFFTIIKWIFG